MNKASLALCFAIVIVSVLRSESSPVARTDDQKCKDLCNLCSCVGFYCGDECICECNNKDDENVNCVEAMQRKCAKLDVPYEVLIQGPAGSRFVRSLLTEDSTALKATNPKKRSSVSVFKPDENQEATPEETAPVVEAKEETNQDDSAKDDVKVADALKPVEDVNTDDEAKPKADEQDAEETKAEEKAKREVDNKENEKSSDSEQTKDDAPTEQTKDDAADQSKTNESNDEAPVETDKPKEDESADKQKDEEPTDADSEDKKDDAQKNLKKRDVETSEIQATLDDASSQSGPSSDDSKSDTNTDPASSTEPTVGLALPIIPPLGLKLLPLQLGALNLDAIKTNLKLRKGVLIDTKLAPLKAKIAALNAETKAKLALLPIAKPLF